MENQYVVEVDNSNYASFWQRLAAWFIDTVIVFLSLFFLKFIPDGALAINSLLFSSFAANEFILNYWVIQLAIILIAFWLYFSLMESFPTQGTVGKLALGIKVVNQEGEKLSFTNASGRFFLQLVSICLLGIGHLFALFTENKQAIHDKISKIEVIKR